MTKAELIDHVKGELSKKQATEIVDAVFDAIKESLTTEQKFAYPGFGTFSVRTRAARKGISPRDRKVIDIPASKTVAFRPASLLKDKLG